MSRYLHDLSTDLNNLAVRFDSESRRAQADVNRLSSELPLVIAALEDRRRGELAWADPAGTGSGSFRSAAVNAINAKYDEMIAGERVRYGTKIDEARARQARESWRAEQARQGLLGVDPSATLDLFDVRRDAPELVAEAFKQERVTYYSDAAVAAVA